MCAVTEDIREDQDMLGELHEIALLRGPEKGECRCMDCGECTAQVTGHSQVLAMQADAVRHAMATGHRVAEHSEATMVVGPPAPRAAARAR